MRQPHKCRSCGTLIYWLKHSVTGKAAPVDAAPSAKGNLKVDLDAGTYSVEFGTTPPAYINHFATCGQAKQWRRCGGIQVVTEEARA